MNIIKKMYVSLVVLLTASSFAAADLFLRTSATGKGTLKSKTKSGRFDERQFSFSVQTNLDGSVTGQAILVDPNAEGATEAERYTLELDISCMNVIGNEAFFGGTTTRTTDPQLVDAAYFSVHDSGSGIDKISRLFFFDDNPETLGDPQLCVGNRPGDFPLEAIDSGEITLTR